MIPSSLQIGADLIGTSAKAKNLGVIIDPRRSLTSHITATCRTALVGYTALVESSATYLLMCSNQQSMH